MEEGEKIKTLRDFIESTCDRYCESMTDQEFVWLVDGLTESMKKFLKNKVDNM